MTERGPANPRDVAEIFDGDFSPWFSDVKSLKYRGRLGVGLVASNHDGGIGYVDEPGEPVYARFLSNGNICRAFSEVEPKLCCSGSMMKDGFGAGCAQDADLILQQAVYRRQVWA